MRSIILLLIFAPAFIYGQENITLKISEGKTTHLIFPSAVKYFDYGSVDVGVTETTEPNIIKVKAAISHFPQTNLTVMTDDNVFYSFMLEYMENPNVLNYFFKSDQGKQYVASTEGSTDSIIDESNSSNGLVRPENSTDVQVDLIQFDLLKKIKRDSYVTGEKKNRIALVLNEIYVDDQYLYFVMDATNESAINYDIDFIKFFIKPRRKRKQATIQDLEITPVNSFNVPKVLTNSPEGMSYFVYVLNKFTVADDKKFVVEMWEKNGERFMELEINNKILLSAKSLSTLN